MALTEEQPRLVLFNISAKGSSNITLDQANNVYSKALYIWHLKIANLSYSTFIHLRAHSDSGLSDAWIQ